MLIMIFLPEALQRKFRWFGLLTAAEIIRLTNMVVPTTPIPYQWW